MEEYNRDFKATVNGVELANALRHLRLSGDKEDNVTVRVTDKAGNLHIESSNFQALKASIEVGARGVQVGRGYRTANVTVTRKAFLGAVSGASGDVVLKTNQPSRDGKKPGFTHLLVKIGRRQAKVLIGGLEINPVAKERAGWGKPDAVIRAATLRELGAAAKKRDPITVQEIFGKVSYAAGKLDAANRHGYAVCVRDGKLNIAATNDMEIAITTVAADGSLELGSFEANDGVTDLLLPQNVFSGLGLLSDQSGDVSLWHSPDGNWLVFAQGGAELHVARKPIGARQWRDILPPDSMWEEKGVAIDAEEVLRMVRLAGMYAERPNLEVLVDLVGVPVKPDGARAHKGTQATTGKGGDVARSGPAAIGENQEGRMVAGFLDDEHEREVVSADVFGERGVGHLKDAGGMTIRVSSKRLKLGVRVCLLDASKRVRGFIQEERALWLQGGSGSVSAVALIARGEAE